MKTLPFNSIILVADNSLTHRSDFLSGNEVILNVLTDVERSLNTCKIYVPLTDSVDFNIAVVEYSAPERTVNITRKDLGEHAFFFNLIEYASLLYNVCVIELNRLASELDNVNNYHNERNYEPEEKNSPELKCGKNALFSYDVRSVNIHI